MTTSPSGTVKGSFPTGTQQRQTPQSSKHPATPRATVGGEMLNPTPKGQDYTESSISQHLASRASQNSIFFTVFQHIQPR